MLLPMGNVPSSDSLELVGTQAQSVGLAGAKYLPTESRFRDRTILTAGKCSKNMYLSP